jgi:hypothetical protein
MGVFCPRAGVCVVFVCVCVSSCAHYLLWAGPGVGCVLAHGSATRCVAESAHFCFLLAPMLPGTFVTVSASNPVLQVATGM